MVNENIPPLMLDILNDQGMRQALGWAAHGPWPMAGGVYNACMPAAVSDYMSKNFVVWRQKHGVVIRAFVKWLDNNIGASAGAVLAARPF
jgi:hypothetical protein